MYDLGGYGPVIIITLWTEAAIALIFVCMRLFTRIWINRVVGWDDFLIAFTCLMLIPYATTVTLACFKGLGRHQMEIALENFIYAVKLEVIGQTFGAVGIATSKASVAAFLLRLSVKTWHKWVLWIVIITVSVGCFLVALFDFIRCDPIESIWNFLLLAEAKCWMSAAGYTTLSIVVGSISSAADFILAVLPWFILWDLRMYRKDKSLIAASMSLGIFAGACGIVRTLTVKRIATGTDYSYETVGLILWNSTELTVSILCATIPTLRPLYKEFLSLFRRHNHTPSYQLDDTPPVKSEGFDSSKNSNVVQSESSGGVDDKSRLSTRDGSLVCADVGDVQFQDQRPYTGEYLPSRDWSKRGAHNWSVV